MKAATSHNHQRFTANFSLSCPQPAEAATGGVRWKKVCLEISQNSQENTYARVSF